MLRMVKSNYLVYLIVDVLSGSISVDILRDTRSSSLKKRISHCIIGIDIHSPRHAGPSVSVFPLFPNRTQTHCFRPFVVWSVLKVLASLFELFYTSHLGSL